MHSHFGEALSLQSRFQVIYRRLELVIGPQPCALAHDDHGKLPLFRGLGHFGGEDIQFEGFALPFRTLDLDRVRTFEVQYNVRLQILLFRTPRRD